VGIPLLLIGIYIFRWLSPNRYAVRHPVFINWCISWIIFSLNYVLLLYAGQMSSVEPPFALCLTQASMIYSAGGMIGVSSLVFVYYINTKVRHAINGMQDVKMSNWSIIMMLIAPYAVFLVIFCIEMLVALQHAEAVHRSSFYCTIDHPIAHLGPGIAGGMITGACIFQVYTMIKIFRHWKSIGKHLKSNENGVNISLIIRMTIFTVAAFLGVLISLTFITQLKSVFFNIGLSIFPLLVLVVFGSSKDLLFRCSRRKLSGTTMRKSSVADHCDFSTLDDPPGDPSPV